MSLLKPAFDCSAARIQEIRARYGKVANNPALETKVVSQRAEHEHADSETHRYYEGFVAEEHVHSGSSGAEWDRYTYRWRGQEPYFEYVVGRSDADGIQTEIRRYAGAGGADGPLCRCLFRRPTWMWRGPPPSSSGPCSCVGRASARGPLGVRGRVGAAPAPRRPGPGPLGGRRPPLARVPRRNPRRSSGRGLRAQTSRKPSPPARPSGGWLLGARRVWRSSGRFHCPPQTMWTGPTPAGAGSARPPRIRARTSSSASAVHSTQLPARSWTP